MSSGQDERYGRLSTTIRARIDHGGSRRDAVDDVPDDDDGLIRHELLFDGATVHARQPDVDAPRWFDRCVPDLDIEGAALDSEARGVELVHGPRSGG
jgi:hypothetical protein